MSTLRDRLLPRIDRIRGIPQKLGERQVQITVRRRVWSGGRRGLGTAVDTDTAIIPRCKVQNIPSKEIAASGGRYEMEDLRCGPITPEYSGGGFSPEALKPSGATGTEIVYVLTGSVAGEYQLVELHTERAFSYMMVIRRMRSTP